MAQCWKKTRFFVLKINIKLVLFYQINSNILSNTSVCSLEISTYVKLELALFRIVNLANF